MGGGRVGNSGRTPPPPGGDVEMTDGNVVGSSVSQVPTYPIEKNVNVSELLADCMCRDRLVSEKKGASHSMTPPVIRSMFVHGMQGDQAHHPGLTTGEPLAAQADNPSTGTTGVAGGIGLMLGNARPTPPMVPTADSDAKSVAALVEIMRRHLDGLVAPVVHAPVQPTVVEQVQPAQAMSREEMMAAAIAQILGTGAAAGGRGLDAHRPPPLVVAHPNSDMPPVVKRHEVVSRDQSSTPSVHSEETNASRRRIVRRDRVPVGPVDRMPPFFFGQTPQASINPTPSMRSEGPQARVNVVQAGGIMGMANPILTEALRSAKVKKFSGRAADFGEFEKSWNLYLRLMYGASGGPLPDDAVLLTLMGYLDEASATLLSGKMDLNPNLSYYDFWQDLRSKFVRDARAMHRQNWRNVQLQIAGPKVTLQDWEKFQALYVSRRSLVEDWTEAEDIHGVFSQIPIQFHSKVLAETGRRRNGKHWVRIGAPQGCTTHETQTMMENELGFNLNVITREKRHFVVACENERQARRLMDYDRGEVDRATMTVSPEQYAMSGDDLLAYIHRLLEQDEELDQMRRTYCHGVGTPRAGVRAVQDQFPRSPSNYSGGSGRGSQGSRPRGDKGSSEKKTGKGSAQGGRKSDTRDGKSQKKSEPQKKGGKADAGKQKEERSTKEVRDKGKCWTCEDLKVAADHDFRTCAKYLEWKKKKDSERKAARAAASDSSKKRPE